MRRPHGIKRLVRDLGFTEPQAERFTELVRRGKSVEEAEREAFKVK